MTGPKLAHDWFPQALPENVQLGDRSWLYSSFAFLHYKSQRPCAVQVGSDSGMYNGTFFDLGPEGEVKIGHYCTLVGVIISTNGRVSIGDFSFLAHEVVIADSFASVPGDETRKVHSRRNQCSVFVGENVWVGAHSVLLSGATIGDGAIVGAAAVVDFEVPAYSIVAGNPARVVGRVK